MINKQFLAFLAFSTAVHLFSYQVFKNVKLPVNNNLILMSDPPIQNQTSYQEKTKEASTNSIKELDRIISDIDEILDEFRDITVYKTLIEIDRERDAKELIGEISQSRGYKEISGMVRRNDSLGIIYDHATKEGYSNITEIIINHSL
jgi:hypothetical protein